MMPRFLVVLLLVALPVPLTGTLEPDECLEPEIAVLLDCAAEAGADTDDAEGPAWDVVSQQDVLADVLLADGDGVCYEERPGHGDTIEVWTPMLVVNSPLGGSAKHTSTTSIEVGFKFGTHGVSLNGLAVEEEAVSIPAEDGQSWGLYFFAEWTHINLEYVGNAQSCLEVGEDKNYWGITDDAPRGIPETRVTELTGASRETDADNVARPVIGADPVMSIDYRFKENDEKHCVEPGGSYTKTRSTLYKLSVSFEQSHSSTVVGAHRAATHSDEYAYTFPSGSCIAVDNFKNGGLAFSWLGFDDTIDPKVKEAGWSAPRFSGCDGPNDLEDRLGEFDTEIYGLHAQVQDVTYIKVEGKPDTSQWIPSLGPTLGEFEFSDIATDQARFWKGSPTDPDASVFDLDSTGSATIDFELPEAVNPVMKMQYEAFELPPCSEVLPAAVEFGCLPAPWGHDAGLKKKFYAEWSFLSLPPVESEPVCPSLEDQEVKVLWPGMVQTWTMTAIARVNGVALPSASDAINVEVHYGFS